MMIPELLTTLSGERVSTVRDWEDFRKEEIAELFCHHVYGHRDMERPSNEEFAVECESVVYGMRKRDLRCVHLYWRHKGLEGGKG